MLIAAKGWWRPRDPASMQRNSATPFLAEVTGESRSRSYPLRDEAHNERREAEQTWLLATPGPKRRLRKKRKAYWQHPETPGWGGGSSWGKPAKTGPCLISNFKEENSSELIGPKSKYGQVRNMWSPQQPGGCERWRLTKATGLLPVF